MVTQYFIDQLMAEDDAAKIKLFIATRWARFLTNKKGFENSDLNVVFRNANREAAALMYKELESISKYAPKVSKMLSVIDAWLATNQLIIENPLKDLEAAAV